MKLLRRSGSAADPVLRPSAAFLWAAAGILLAGGLTAGLLVVYRSADAQRVATLLDIVRIGLSVGAGTGGLFALWLATRRQRSAEQTLVLQQEVSRSTVTDSTERRITDQYSKAIDQLGHEKAAVRLGAIYSLERIAQDHPGHRQTVVDVFCSYLRLPYDPEQAATDDSRSELEVRRTVQHMIWAHLGDPEKRAIKDKFWPGMTLDLSRAILVDPNFGYLSLRSLKCENTIFHGVANFQGLTVEGLCGFGAAKVSGKTHLANSVFRGGLVFINSTFGADVDLAGVVAEQLFTVIDCEFRENVALTGLRGVRLMVHECHFGGNLLLDGGELSSIIAEKNEFEGLLVTDGLRLEVMSFFVGSHFQTAPARHERIVHVRSLQDTGEAARAIAEHYGIQRDLERLGIEWSSLTAPGSADPSTPPRTCPGSAAEPNAPPASP